MIDLHTHTFLSDGELIPTELVRRAEVRGYRGLVFSDHVDHANIDFVVPALVKVCEALNPVVPMRLVPGAELTHVRPEHVAELAARARDLGARVVLVHGETIAEPVIPGTNRAAIEAGVDVLAHPGLITPDEVKAAAAKGVRLEVSGRKGHSLTNGHVARLARQFGAMLVFGSDSHSPSDLVTRPDAERILLGAGLDADEVAVVFENSARLIGLDS